MTSTKNLATQAPQAPAETVPVEEYRRVVARCVELGEKIVGKPQAPAGQDFATKGWFAALSDARHAAKASGNQWLAEKLAEMHVALASMQPEAPAGQGITLQEAWLAIGGNPDPMFLAHLTKSMVLDAIEATRDSEEELNRASMQPEAVFTAAQPSDAAPMNFRCPACKSQPGVPCIGTMSGFHFERRALASTSPTDGERKE